MVAAAHAAPSGLDSAVRVTMPSPAGWDVGHVSFADVLSAVNPLQYLPVVGTIYRALTGDEVHPALRIAVSGVASLVLGGPIGLAATMLVAVADEVRHGHQAAPPSAQSHAAAAHAYGRLARST